MERAAVVLLELLGVLALAAGVVGGLWPLLDSWSLCAGGVVALVGAAIADRRNSPRTDPPVPGEDVP